jgi:hypothetical protein
MWLHLLIVLGIVVVSRLLARGLGSLGDGIDRRRTHHPVSGEVTVSVVPAIAEPIKSPRQHALDAASDHALDFAYYDRREDDELSEAMLEALVRSGEIRIEEIVASFERTLRECLGEVGVAPSSAAPLQ